MKTGVYIPLLVMKGFISVRKWHKMLNSKQAQKSQMYVIASIYLAYGYWNLLKGLADLGWASGMGWLRSAWLLLHKPEHGLLMITAEIQVGKWKDTRPTLEAHTLSPTLHCIGQNRLPKGNQSWIFTGRTDAEAEAPIFWPPNAMSWLTGKDPDAGKDWRWEEKGTTEDEMIRWHPQLTGRWVWVNSGSWRWTGRPGVLQFLRSQRVRHDWATELKTRYLAKPKVKK